MKTLGSVLVTLLIVLFVFPVKSFAQEESWFPEFLEGEQSVVVPDSLAEYFDFARTDTILRVAVVLSDIYSKKDMEFTRGFLLGIDRANLPANSVSLKVVNGEIPEDSLQYELDLYGPHVIFSTFEKDTPRVLRTFTQENGNSLVNVFDAKGDDYLYNENVYQLLMPSDKFNTGITRYIIDNFAGNTLVLIGDPDLDDPSMLELIRNWPEEELMILSKEDLGVFEFEDGINYLFYPLFSSNDDVKDTMSHITKLIADMPSAGVRIFGRPNWIAFNDLASMIANLEVFVPAKVYFSPAAESSKRFIAAYNSSFGHAPIRSYPVFAVMGYDAAEYFLPAFSSIQRGNFSDWMPRNMEQSYFNLKKSDFGGYYNQGGFILHYEPWGTMSKDFLN